MRHRLVYGLLMAVVLCGQGAVGVTMAFASGLSPPVADCNAHTRLTRHYTVKQLENALATMPAEISEYSDCHDVISHQLLVQLGRARSGGGSGGGGGTFLPAWLIALLAVLVVGAAGFGVLAMRERRRGPGDEPPLN
jgi:hypothetical protein